MMDKLLHKIDKELSEVARRETKSVLRKREYPGLCSFAAINDSKLKTPEKHGGLCQPRFDFDKSTARQISLTRGLLPTNYFC